MSNIWFKNLPGDKNQGHRNLESMITSKNATVFLKKGKNLKSITVIEKNLEELFTSATKSSTGF